MMKSFRHDIFGSTYQFLVGTREETGLDPKFSGDTDVHTKVIRIATDVDEFNQTERADDIRRKILIHEMAHAALYETGLLDYFDDETLVQWLEVMLPKLDELSTVLNGKLVETVIATAKS